MASEDVQVLEQMRATAKRYFEKYRVPDDDRKDQTMLLAAITAYCAADTAINARETLEKINATKPAGHAKS